MPGGHDILTSLLVKAVGGAEDWQTCDFFCRYTAGTLTRKASGVVTSWKLRCVSGCSHRDPVTSSLSVSVWFVTEANALFTLAVM